MNTAVKTGESSTLKDAFADAVAGPAPYTAEEFYKAAQTGDAARLKEMLAQDKRYLDELNTAGGETALTSAVLGKHYEAAKVLLEAGASPSKPNQLLLSPLLAAMTVMDEKMIDLLLPYKPELNFLGTSETSALAVAIAQNENAIARKLLAAGANPDIAGEDGITCVMLAAYNIRPEQIRLLKEFKADLDKRATDDNSTALDHSITSENHGVFDVLVELGANLANPDAAGFTPAHRAASANNTHALKVLKEKGAPLDEPDELGNRPLTDAAFNNAAEAGKMLIGFGVKVKAENNAGRTARQEAEIKGNRKFMDVIDAENARQVTAAMREGLGQDIAAPPRAQFKKKVPKP